ncbi:MAG: ribosome maturation factor RimM [Acidobacteriota bacterium]
MPEAVHVAKIVATRGLRGKVVAIGPGVSVEGWGRLTSVLVSPPSGCVRRLKLRRVWRQRGRLILHFHGIETIDAGADLVGAAILLPENELPTLPQGSYYTFRLKGLKVVDKDGRLLGHVRDTESTPAHDLLVVEKDTGGTAMVPMTHSMIPRIDLDGECVVVDPPAGLLHGDEEVVTPLPRRTPRRIPLKGRS